MPPAYWVQNAGQAWSFTNPGGDGSTFRFEVRPGDNWSAIDPFTSERSEIAFTTHYSMGTDIHVSYDFQVEPGEANHAKWLAFGQFHQTNNAGGWQQPFGVFLSGEKMAIYINNAGNLPNDWSKYPAVYRDDADIVRGHTYHMQIDVNFDLASGYLHVVRDGVAIVDYRGPLGWADMGAVYWKEGIYRGASDTTLAVTFSNLEITTGPAPTVVESAPVSQVAWPAEFGGYAGGEAAAGGYAGLIAAETEQLNAEIWWLQSSGWMFY